MEIFSRDGKLLFRTPDGWEPTFGDRDLLSGGAFREAVLDGTDLSGANLSDACLAGASFYHSFLVGVNFAGADLEGASLRGSDLEDADLRFANLKSADFSLSAIGGITRLGGANFSGANVVGANFQGALYDSSTMFPEGFSPKAHGMLTFDEYQKLLSPDSEKPK